MRALIIAIGLVGYGLVARAAPKYTHAVSTSKDPAVVAAERAWTIAAASRGPAASDLWEDAASAFVVVVEAGTLPDAELQSAALSALSAFKNAFAVDPRTREKPAEIDPFERRLVAQEVTKRDQKMISMLERIERHIPDRDEVAGMKFLRANIWRRYNHFAKSTPIYLDLIENHRAHEVAEYSANLLLDTYNREMKYPELVELAKKLRADKAFLAKRDDLAATVNKIYAQAQGLVARNAMERGRDTGDRSHFERCAEAYLSILDSPRLRHEDDTVVYNAMICYQQAGSIDRALAIVTRLTTELPDSTLAKLAGVHVISMLATVGRFDEAATAGERWLRANTLERDAADLLEDTIRWRVATGSLDVAVRILDEYTTRVRRVPAMLERRALVAVSLARAILDDARTRPPAEYARQRALALRILERPPPISRRRDHDGPARVAVARVYAEAACPAALVDGLCTRPRDNASMAIARRELARITNRTDGATLLLADLALEAILANRAPTANLSADYVHLTSSADAEVRVAAHARLAALAHHAQDADARAAHLEACAAEGAASRGGDTWRAICERDLRRGRDVLPPARAPAPLALEAPMIAKPLPAASRRLD